MNLTFPQLLAGAVGALLIYSAVVNKTPVGVLKDAFNNTTTTRTTNPNALNSALTGKTPLKNQWTGGTDTGGSF